MQITNNTKPTYATKDNPKGQKIVAALYLVTGHLADIDPIKSKLRTLAIGLLETQNSNLKELIQNIQGMLNITIMANIISQKNATTLIAVLDDYLFQINSQEDISSLFVDESEHQSLSDNYKISQNNLSYKPLEKSTVATAPKPAVSSKSKRQNEILSFINKNKSVGIKDISTMFPDISEKTVQRELGSLVTSGAITKRGSKRWSVYLAVSK